MKKLPENNSLQDKEVILIVDPSGVGKSAIIGYILDIDPNIGHPTPFTTRPPRPDDKPGLYDYTTDAELRQMSESEIAQQIAHPDGTVYGTLTSSYTKRLSVLDVMTESVDDFHRAGFARVSVLGIIASTEEWMRRLNLRYPKGHPSRQHRLSEALRCFEWMSTNKPPILINDAPTNEPAARQILDHLHNDNDAISKDQTAARQILADAIARTRRELDSL